MVRRKRWSEDWHHRAPDFRLVYCGPKNRVKEEAKELPEKRMVEASITSAGHVEVVESCINRCKTTKVKH